MTSYCRHCHEHPATVAISPDRLPRGARGDMPIQLCDQCWGEIQRSRRLPGGPHWPWIWIAPRGDYGRVKPCPTLEQIERRAMNWDRVERLRRMERER